MALGVLNNLAAIYAENNLNNTNNSLQTVLQQLSSGSRINSGADDAAGLSLVNGLAANSAALTQSETNATEGVGLLQVADGALSQVTSLLNRAITLATEASNGTLNSTQESAANQEYQSILAEINNIGSTTTYNQQQVFNDSTTAIYTGDSSQAGSSVDDLFIRTLSSSSVGDTDGAMSYSSGQNNVFIDLSKGGTNASASDSLNASGETTITVSYLAKGSSGTVTPATANITVGTGTNYANTAQGLIDAINGSGLGLSASFGTAVQAGTVAEDAATAADAAGGGDSDTGILISGIGVGTGTNGAGEIGTLTVAGSADLLGGTLTIVGSDGRSHSVALGVANSTDTLANLAATINAADWGVTASTNTGVVSGNSAGTVLTFMSASSSVTVSGTSLTDNGAATALTGVPTVDASYSSTIGTITETVAGASFTAGTLNIGANAAITLGQVGKTDTLANLAATINAGNYGVTASLNAAGKVLTFASANSADTFSVVGATVGAGAVSSTTAVANHSQIGTLSDATGWVVGTSNGDAMTTGGTIKINGNTVYTSTAGQTLDQIATSFNALNLGMTATMNDTTGIMTFVSTNVSTEGEAITTTLHDTVLGNNLVATTDTPSVANSAYYSVGISGAITDTSTNGGTLNAGMVSDTNGTGGAEPRATPTAPAPT